MLFCRPFFALLPAHRSMGCGPPPWPTLSQRQRPNPEPTAQAITRCGITPKPPIKEAFIHRTRPGRWPPSALWKLTAPIQGSSSLGCSFLGINPLKATPDQSFIPKNRAVLFSFNRNVQLNRKNGYLGIETGLPNEVPGVATPSFFDKYWVGWKC